MEVTFMEHLYMPSPGFNILYHLTVTTALWGRHYYYFPHLPPPPLRRGGRTEQKGRVGGEADITAEEGE